MEIKYLHDDQLINHVTQLLMSGHVSELEKIKSQRVYNIYRRLSTTTINHLPNNTYIYLFTNGFLDERYIDRTRTLDINIVSQLDTIVLIGLHDKIDHSVYDLINNFLSQPNEMNPIISQLLSQSDKIKHLMTKCVNIDMIEQWAINHKCHVINLYCQYNIELLPLQFSSLKNPLLWLHGWCDHCRRQLIPFNNCIKNDNDLLQVCVLMNKFGTPSDLIKDIIMSHITTPIMLSQLIEKCENLRAYFSNYAQHLPKIQYPSPSWMFINYIPECDVCYNIDLHRLSECDFIKNPTLIEKTNEEYWLSRINNSTYSIDQKKCEYPPIISIVASKYPNVLYRNPTIIAKYQYFRNIRHLMNNMVVMLVAKQSNNPFLLLNTETIKKNLLLYLDTHHII